MDRLVLPSTPKPGCVWLASPERPYTLVAAFLSMRANAPSSILSLKLPVRTVILLCRFKSSVGSSFNIGSCAHEVNLLTRQIDIITKCRGQRLLNLLTLELLTWRIGIIGQRRGQRLLNLLTLELLTWRIGIIGQ